MEPVVRLQQYMNQALGCYGWSVDGAAVVYNARELLCWLAARGGRGKLTITPQDDGALRYDFADGAAGMAAPILERTPSLRYEPRIETEPAADCRRSGMEDEEDGDY